jgi:methionine biosynthesis protein MetW
MAELRPEFRAIVNWIKPDSRVLDLGCGDGTLLAHLRDQRNVIGYGLEISQNKIVKALGNKVNVIQFDLDAGLTEFDSNSFDYVIMSQTLQAMHYPDDILDEMLRVGREGIVTFPNFGHWRCRLQLLAGRMPVTRSLPNRWYNTPNIHLCTLTDFENLCTNKNYHILDRSLVDSQHQARVGSLIAPNLMGEIAVYRFRRS